MAIQTSPRKIRTEQEKVYSGGMICGIRDGGAVTPGYAVIDRVALGRSRRVLTTAAFSGSTSSLSA